MEVLSEKDRFSNVNMLSSCYVSTMLLNRKYFTDVLWKKNDQKFIFYFLLSCFLALMNIWWTFWNTSTQKNISSLSASVQWSRYRINQWVIHPGIQCHFSVIFSFQVLKKTVDRPFLRQKKLNEFLTAPFQNFKLLNNSRWPINHCMKDFSQV